MNPLFIIFGAITIISVAGMLTGVVIEWIKSRKETSVVNDDAFLDALSEFKQKTDRRLTALEGENRTLMDRMARFEATEGGSKSIGTMNRTAQAPSPPPSQPTQRMEDSASYEDEEGQKSGSRLRNMLR